MKVSDIRWRFHFYPGKDRFLMYGHGNDNLYGVTFTIELLPLETVIRSNGLLVKILEGRQPEEALRYCHVFEDTLCGIRRGNLSNFRATLRMMHEAWDQDRYDGIAFAKERYRREFKENERTKKDRRAD